MMELKDVFLLLLAYVLYIAFWVRFFIHARTWLQASGHSDFPLSRTPSVSCRACAITALDVFFFRRLFANDKILWPGSWLFHLAFFLVILRHLRYFLQPVPDCISAIQPFVVFAGYVLFIALLYILCVRLVSGKKRYISYSNYFILTVLLLTSLSGLMMRNFFRPDLLQTKAFILGTLTFSPEPAPSGMLFSLHFLMALLLLPYVPFHIFTAPIIMGDSTRRKEGLRMIMHEE